ncbi:hypothetical protein KIH41_17160 [Litoribacter ruber]|uniref:hypothetical protein n=1 Tax=Litoribacter ruber TaxID=702568 RepID=UPI001BDAD92D|nr:hypothetical protein [Litoribacter ruber]MBT0813020.1 hypothetical protein [Litoribacter ruber]
MAKQKRFRTIISSTHLDSHGHIMDKQALEEMEKSINCTDKMIRFGVDHRRDFPPRGRLENASLIEKVGHYYLEADFVEYNITNPVDWDQNLILQSFDNNFQFAEVVSKENLEDSISIDLQNFRSNDEARNFVNRVSENEDFKPKIKIHGRKSAIPDPEIIFQFAGTCLLYQIIKPTAKRLGENIADAIVDNTTVEINKLSKFI